MRRSLMACIGITMAWSLCGAQSIGKSDSTGADTGSGKGFNNFIPVVMAPAFAARLAVGFNYDWLKDPTRVSYDYPRGYIGLNIPLSYSIDQKMTDKVTSDLADMWPHGDRFEPTASAKQNANTTIRVDVPMAGGVGEFSNIQNFYLKYSNTLGEPRILIHPPIDTIQFMMQGMISVPLDMSFGWESMTFGYAYKLNNNLKFAVNLTRHIFRADVSARMDIDLLGYLQLNLPTKAAPSTGQAQADNLIQNATSDILKGIPRQNISYSLSGEAQGHYETEIWAPTFALHLWRLGCVYRMGIEAHAPGHLSAKYSVPFFVDKQTFAMKDLSDPKYLMDNMNRFLNGETDSIEYRSTSDLLWKMPHGLTFSFDLVREKLYLSYTKFIGEISMTINNIQTITHPTGTGSDTVQTTKENVNFDVGVQTDNILMLHGAFQNAFINLGVFTMDFRYAEKNNLLSKVYPLPVLGGALLPVVNFGTTFGSKLKLQLELDLLPLSALKTGVIYYF